MCDYASLLLFCCCWIKAHCISLYSLVLYLEGRNRDNRTLGSFDSMSLLLENNVHTVDRLREPPKVKKVTFFKCRQYKEKADITFFPVGGKNCLVQDAKKEIKTLDVYVKYVSSKQSNLSRSSW